MAIYKTLWFNRWARKQGLNDTSLCNAVLEITQGLYEADLGGGLLKKRVARPGQGKRGGFRTLIATNMGNLWFFVYGFAKNERSNIDKDEEEGLKKLSAHLLSLTPKDLEKSIENDGLIEVDCDEKNEVSNS
ncbi:type II toxin-antitoxin system RelE/ParE family toxin [Aetokthonos hydrillicola Thurmond2011]|jgi:hypothetical protein|uniref:Type II toxin-antitoxin system RelE/ParE family toxin n=1 Tax=Aetokthonos hydrillicola Thurmond2011 TaxID=2712845 RepID=A0AAP5I8Q7_9CYAN|nr:type II toxin-antitoxin system RelE/ParE family toxin [Aetokthonos hydrillicola]MBO3460983.1 type II toxin-antitoxin system RelE/ParE family toxin [Aetokthonos hydrillicola CCALA 1050]MBW4583657.1 type II toxin-antitoxin system RelE/ParE family toxin [Aetokthonos hydrillicola CCALA 1050]MDR9895647.1 type II toxin-antitoxin system RelE/ParE family toxin [Aetokthonos hydrillicola Thurmond2011]